MSRHYVVKSDDYFRDIKIFEELTFLINLIFRCFPTIMTAKRKIPRSARGIPYELHSYFNQSYKNSRARGRYIRPEYFNSRGLKLSSISPFVNTLSNHTIALMERRFTVERGWIFQNKETFSVSHIKIAHIKIALFTPTSRLYRAYVSHCRNKAGESILLDTNYSTSISRAEIDTLQTAACIGHDKRQRDVKPH